MVSNYKKIFENSKEGLLVTDSNGVIEIVNPGLIELFGYEKQDDLIGQKIEILIPSELRKKHQTHRKGFNANPTSRAMETGKKLSAIRKDGSTFPVEVNLSHFDDNGELKIITFVVDITERIRIEGELLKLNTQLEHKVQLRTKEIKTQNKLLRSIAENFPNGNIYVVNENFIIEWADGKLIRELGLTDKSLVGLSFKNRLPDRIKADIIDQFKKLMEGESIRYELTDNNRHFSIYGVPLDVESQDLKTALLVELDITTDKKNEIEMLQNLANEKRLNEMKSRFVSMASHEFRTPLSIIISSATIIGKYTKEEQQLQREKHIDRIKRSVSNLSSILNDFLSLDKLESGVMDMHPKLLNLEEFSGEIAEEFKVLCKPEQQFHTSFEFHVAKVYVDSVILKNCCLNLLSNAIKYSGDNAIIELNIETNKDVFIIDIKDNGIGIPKEEQKELFSRFFRAKNVTNIPGTGLGLNIVKRYVDLIGGEITFKSELEKGTEFTIQIPFENLSNNRK